jgi:hypothetical protein
MAALKIDELRTIGWSEWDPIGLRGADWKPPTGAEGEYDSYLLHVVKLLDEGVSRQAATKYLEGIAKDYMGLGYADEAAAARTVDAVERLLLDRSN